MQVESKNMEKCECDRTDSESCHTQTHAHRLDEALMSLVCGYGSQPDGLLTGSDGSSLSCAPSPHPQKAQRHSDGIVSIKAGAGSPEGRLFRFKADVGDGWTQRGSSQGPSRSA